MNILAFDTSGNNLSTCLKTADGFFEENITAGLKHSENLLPSIERLLGRAGIGAPKIGLIVCSRGPGSFTGLRIGMSTAKGISSGCGAPLVSVNCLDAYAFGLDFFEGAVVPVIDARKNRFYSAVYSGGSRLSDYLDVSADDLVSQLSGYERVLFTGAGSDILKARIASSWFDQNRKVYYSELPVSLASVFIKTGARQYEESGADPEDSGPLYIRLSDAELSKS